MADYDPISIANLLDRNRSWVHRKTKLDPHFFERLVGQQHPNYFWIGCSDSRVPATEIVDIEPGEMFVHRNVANLVSGDDLNFNSALLFAVNVLHVRHIIVVGHYGCGGIHAATSAPTEDVIGQWLSPLHALYRRHIASLSAIHETEDRENRFCELNVIEQIQRLASNPIIISAWQQGWELILHGLVYSIADGLLKKVCDQVASEW